MKNLNKLYILLFAVLVFATSCEDLTEINEDPNRPTEVPVEYLLTSAERQLGNRLYGGFDNVAFGMTVSQYWAQNEYSDETRYQFRANTNNTFWSDFYTAINDLQEIKKVNTTIDKGQQGINQNAVATILQSWAYHSMVDIYGDIPFEEALQGVDIPSPAYSDQELIYSALIDSVSSAVAAIDPSAPGFPGGDVIFDGDLSKWQKFGNSLLLRIGIRLSDVNPSLAEQTISAAAEGAMKSNADNAAIQYITAQPNVNPLYVSYVVNGRQDYCATENFIELLNGLGDPRIGEYFVPAANTGTFEGLPYGVTSAVAAGISRDAVSQLNPQVYAADFPGTLMGFVETSFILAEAASNGWIGGSAADYYAQAITASMNYWNITDGNAIGDYIAANPYTEDNLKVQKYIAMYYEGWQSWAEIRRLDLESLPAANLVEIDPAVNFVDVSNILNRRLYPQDEQNLNGANYQNAASNIGSDAYDTNLFWDLD
ncbi:SusD/RagB family nutrient-binding outer membrane lipoprotein [Marivirga arenosa]|uniref:SusD/RagB family nutrient-binding outer membrane lipoprotein n=1 Tax=Marivirga arenosa TaxID=3059076 RepID=A0AA51N6C1_9BACT|nr:SusD/RagB family nutrient-binding outer membrane lipoprotein [Marivirga sp. ABR2-2]WMN06445.1 SusD/RagB family nutrient-binding outer membrane lipoprotein [Marivirga sp. ABR2-2]